MEGAHELDNGNVRGRFATRGTIRASGLELSGASAIGSALPHEHVSTRRHINWPRARPRLPVRALHPTLPRSSPRLPPPPRNNTTSRQSHYNHDRQEHIGGTKDAAGDHQCASELPLSPVASVYRFRCRYAPASPSLAHSHLSCRPDR